MVALDSVALRPGFRIRSYWMLGLTQATSIASSQHLVRKQNISRSDNPSLIIQVHSLKNAGWKPGKELTLTLSSPWILILGNKGEGELGEHGGYDYRSYAARGQWNVNKVGVGLVRTSLGGSSYNEVLRVVQWLR